MKDALQRIRCSLTLATCLIAGFAPALRGQTYVSAEPIPSPDVVGTNNLALIESIGYTNMERWSTRLLNDCGVVGNVINSLTAQRAISTVIPGNTSWRVGAGGFEGVTDPTYVLTMRDSGLSGASAQDIFTVDNALGYVLNQGGTAQFQLAYDKRNPYEFAIDYAAVTHKSALSGVAAKAFFDYLGTIDPALWTGTFAGFTQVDLKADGLNDSMVFLQGKVAKAEFIQGLSQAATTAADMTYTPVANNGKPATAQAGVAFPSNDWIASPDGQGYLSNIVNASPQLLSDLATQRQKHLMVVTDLLQAIRTGKLTAYLNGQFSCH